jgi:hypothetical protein
MGCVKAMASDHVGDPLHRAELKDAEAECGFPVPRPDPGRRQG